MFRLTKTRRTPLTGVGLAALLTGLLLASCSTDGSQDVEPTQSLPDKPRTIEPLDELGDATTYSTNGVALQIPNNLEVMNEKLAGDEVGEVTQVAFALPENDRASILLTVENIPEADIKNAEFSALALENSLVVNGVGSEIEMSVLDWPEMDPGAAVSAILDVPLNGTNTERDSFTAIIPHEDILVSVSVETPAGEIDDSQELRALSTLRIE